MELCAESCPLCTEQEPVGSQYDTWLQCDACALWYHSDCLKIPAVDCDAIEIFHCPACVPTHGPSTVKPRPRKSKRDSVKLNYADMNEGLAGDEKIWGKLLSTKTFAPDRFKRYTGDQVTLERFRKQGLKEPFVIIDKEQLDMKMPSGETTVADIAKAVGEDREVEVIDVATQADTPGWTMGKWAEYYGNRDRDRIRNVISLEISGTDFANGIVRPKLVRDMDWIDHMWPEDLRPKEYPKVQLYCLMGTKDSYTDFHVDFGGTSVFYHIIRGSKVFYFIEPTTKNLKKYQKWSSSPEQSTTFLGDEVKSCYSVHLQAGNTMIIPTGWIHAVYTPEDALVIGGNFLHGLNIGTQLRIFDIEEATNVPVKFRFPYFKRINWYAAQNYNSILRDNPKVLSIFELQGIMDLARWLQRDATRLEDSSLPAQERRTIRADIPSSIDDPASLIDNLIYGVENAIVSLSKVKKPKSSHISSNGDKHKVIKLKLKFGQRNDDHESSSPATTDAQKSKLILKLKQQDQPEAASAISDEEYILDDLELNNTIEDDIGEEDSDDDEYQEEDDQDEFKPEMSILPSPKPTAARSVTRKRSTVPHNDGDPGYNSSGSDDDMGTSKRAAGGSSLSTKRSPSVKRAKPSTTSTSVKQRLLDRFVKR